LLIRLGAHEDQLVAARSPGTFDVDGAALVGLGTGHYHAQDSCFVEETGGQDNRKRMSCGDGGTTEASVTAWKGTAFLLHLIPAILPAIPFHQRRQKNTPCHPDQNHQDQLHTLTMRSYSHYFVFFRFALQGEIQQKWS